jgi:plasmid stability protein
VPAASRFSCGRKMLALIAVEEVSALAAISVRNLDDHVKERLRIRAARHGRSMESEIRAILVEAVRDPNDADGLFQTMLDRFGELGGVELELPPRTTPVRAADLSS